MTKLPDWKLILRELNRRLFQDVQGDSDFCLPHDVYKQITADEWLGRAPAAEATIATAEKRLGVTLPPDYRAFLTESNGWWSCMMFPNGLAELVSIESVQWCSDSRHKASIEGVMKDCIETYDELHDYDICSSLLIGIGDGNEYTFLREDGRVCNWEAEIGIVVFESFEALMSSYSCIARRVTRVNNTCVHARKCETF